MTPTQVLGDSSWVFGNDRVLAAIALIGLSPFWLYPLSLLKLHPVSFFTLGSSHPYCLSVLLIGFVFPTQEKKLLVEGKIMKTETLPCLFKMKEKLHSP